MIITMKIICNKVIYAFIGFTSTFFNFFNSIIIKIYKLIIKKMRADWMSFLVILKKIGWLVQFYFISRKGIGDIKNLRKYKRHFFFFLEVTLLRNRRKWISASNLFHLVAIFCKSIIFLILFLFLLSICPIKLSCR